MKWDESKTAIDKMDRSKSDHIGEINRSVGEKGITIRVADLFTEITYLTWEVGKEISSRRYDEMG